MKTNISPGRMKTNYLDKERWKKEEGKEEERTLQEEGTMNRA